MREEEARLGVETAIEEASGRPKLLRETPHLAGQGLEEGGVRRIGDDSEQAEQLQVLDTP